MNAYFASYVREASFNLTLSSEMIETLLRVDRDLKFPVADGYAAIYSRRTSTALYRRGLVVPTSKTDFPKEWMESPSWPYFYEFTEAGRLVVSLLKEAGFRAPEYPATEEIAPPEISLK